MSEGVCPTWGRLGDGGHTGIPAVVMIDKCVEEKMRCPPSLAAMNRRATSADKFSESPNCIAGGTELELGGRSDRGRGGDMRGVADNTKAVMDGTTKVAGIH